MSFQITPNKELSNGFQYSFDGCQSCVKDNPGVLTYQRTDKDTFFPVQCPYCLEQIIIELDSHLDEVSRDIFMEDFKFELEDWGIVFDKYANSIETLSKIFTILQRLTVNQLIVVFSLLEKQLRREGIPSTKLYQVSSFWKTEWETIRGERIIGCSKNGNIHVEVTNEMGLMIGTKIIFEAVECYPKGLLATFARKNEPVRSKKKFEVTFFENWDETVFLSIKVNAYDSETAIAEAGKILSDELDNFNQIAQIKVVALEAENQS